MRKLPLLLIWLLSAPLAFAIEAPAHYPQNPIANADIQCVSDDSLKCFDAHSQQLLWENKTVNSPKGMLLIGNRLYVNRDHTALILNARSGDRIAQLPHPGDLFDPVVSNGQLILTDQQGWMRVIDLNTLHTMWRKQVETRWVYPPAVANGKLISGGRDGVLTALDRDTGKIVWRQKIGQEIVYRPVAAAGKIFVSSFDGLLRAIDPDNGAVLLRTQLGSPVFDIKNDENQRLIASGYDGKLYAIDARSGARLWNRQVADSIRYHFSVKDHDVASIDYQGHFQLIDNQSGRLIQQSRFEGRHHIAPLMTHSKIQLFPAEKPFINVLKQQWGHTDS